MSSRNGKKSKTGQLTSIDLFAGAGGLTCGLEQAGFKCLAASEINTKYATTFLNNIGVEPIVEDIRNVTSQRIKKLTGLKKGELDLLAGGPPCQGFSINAPVRSTKDKRNHLFLEFLRVAKDFEPKCILIENVPGIVSFDSGGTIRAIEASLQKLGYNTCYQILFAGAFGIPQLRFRTFIVGTKPAHFKFLWPDPTHYAEANLNFTGARELCPMPLEIMKGFLRQQPKVSDALSDLPKIRKHLIGKVYNDKVGYRSEAKSDYQKLLRNGDKEVHNHFCADIAEVNLQRLKHIPQGGSWRDIPFDMLPAGLKRAKKSDHTKRYGRLHPDGMCSTILTKCDPHWGSYFHPSEDRVLSVREAARIQSFPDSFKFFGTLTEQYQQVGNAVPPLLAKTIGTQIKGFLINNVLI